MSFERKHWAAVTKRGFGLQLLARNWLGFRRRVNKQSKAKGGEAKRDVETERMGRAFWCGIGGWQQTWRRLYTVRSRQVGGCGVGEPQCCSWKNCNNLRVAVRTGPPPPPAAAAAIKSMAPRGHSSYCRSPAHVTLCRSGTAPFVRPVICWRAACSAGEVLLQPLGMRGHRRGNP
jgi:hypothetical protein